MLYWSIPNTYQGSLWVKAFAKLQMMAPWASGHFKFERLYVTLTTCYVGDKLEGGGANTPQNLVYIFSKIF